MTLDGHWSRKILFIIQYVYTEDQTQFGETFFLLYKTNHSHDCTSACNRNCSFGFFLMFLQFISNHCTYFYVLDSVRSHLVFSLSGHLRAKPCSHLHLWLQYKDISFCIHTLRNLRRLSATNEKGFLGVKQKKSKWGNLSEALFCMKLLKMKLDFHSCENVYAWWILKGIKEITVWLDKSSSNDKQIDNMQIFLMSGKYNIPKQSIISQLQEIL